MTDKTVSVELLYAEKLRHHLRELRSKTEYGPEISRFNLATAIISNIEIEIGSGRLNAAPPAAQSTEIPDWLMDELSRIADMKDRDGNYIDMHRDELRGIAKRLIATCHSVAALTPPAPVRGFPMDERVAQITAHRVCGNQEQDPQAGKLSGYCVVCQIPWPCSYAGTPPANTHAQPQEGE